MNIWQIDEMERETHESKRDSDAILVTRGDLKFLLNSPGPYYMDNADFARLKRLRSWYKDKLSLEDL